MNWGRIDPVDDNALGFENPVHPISELEKVLLGVITAPNPSLVGDDKYHTAEPLGGSATHKDAVNRLKILRLADIGVINVDHTITVKKQGEAAAQWHSPVNSVWVRE